MIYKDTGIVLLISKDRDLKKLFRKIVNKTKKLHFIIDNDINNCPVYPCTRIIFLDISHFNNTKLKSSLSILKKRYLGIPIFVITNNRVSRENPRYCPIDFILTHTPFLIVQKPIREITVKSILFKYTNSLRDRGFDCKKYHGLILDEQQHFAIYNKCKIILTKKETMLLSILMDYSSNDEKISCSNIKSEILNSTDKDTSEECIRICIHRIRKKFKEEIGLNIIDNKYGVGYFITI